MFQRISVNKSELVVATPIYPIAELPPLHTGSHRVVPVAVVTELLTPYGRSQPSAPTKSARLSHKWSLRQRSAQTNTTRFSSNDNMISSGCHHP